MINRRVTGFWLALLVAGILAFAAGAAHPFGNDPDAAVRVEINVPEFKLRVFENGQILRTFPVGIGRPNFPTPIGHYQVISKVEHPIWENPYLGPGARRIGAGRENPLGTRWIGFHMGENGEYGMHGTDSPESVGKLSSHGCVRLRIPDAEVLFGMVSVGTPVQVVYQTHRLEIEEGRLVLTVFADPYGKGRADLKGLPERVRLQYPHAVLFEEVIKAAASNPRVQSITIGFTGRPAPDRSLAR